MTMVHHRFSDFLNMHEAVLGSYAGTALYATLPSPPSRGFTLFQDHFAPEFIENRRLSLARFMTQMEGIPRMRSNVDFVSFLGFSGRVREASVVVPSGPLGLKVESESDSDCICMAAYRLAWGQHLYYPARNGDNFKSQIAVDLCLGIGPVCHVLASSVLSIASLFFFMMCTLFADKDGNVTVSGFLPLPNGKPGAI